MKSTVLHMELCKTHIDTNPNYKLPTTNKGPYQFYTEYTRSTQHQGNLNQKYRETYSQQVESNNNKKKKYIKV